MKPFYLFLLISTFSSVLNAEAFDLYYTANRQGSIEPCGCTVHQIGGLNRMANWLDKEAKGRGGIRVDAGDTFFSAPLLNKMLEASELEKARVIADGYSLMKMDFFTPGERDFALGKKILSDLCKRAKVTLLGANFSDPEGILKIQPFVIKLIGNKKVLITGVMAPDLVDSKMGIQARDSIESIRGVLSSVGEGKFDQLVILSHSGLEKDKALAAYFPRAVIVGSHSMDALERPFLVDKSVILQPTHEGQTVGKLHWDLGKFVVLDHELVDLDASFERPGPVKRLVENYRKRQLAIARKENGKSPLKQEGELVANPHRCKGCHEKQYAFWETTKHASAYLVLYEKDQHFNPECVACHTLGFLSPSGFLKITDALQLKSERRQPSKLSFVEALMKTVFEGESLSEGLNSHGEGERHDRLRKTYHANLDLLSSGNRIVNNYLGVQCEHCHGPRAEHVVRPEGRKSGVEIKTCRGCHVPTRSPAFKESWVSRVACPDGHL